MILNLILITSTKSEEFKNSWDFDFIINDIFKNFTVNIIFNPNIDDIFIENAIIVYSCDDKEINPKLLNYFNEYKKRELKFNLYHLSNESLNHNCNYYNYAKIVFRNYYDYNIKYKNVIVLPLGYKSGFLNKNKNYLKLEDKKYDICFIGALKCDRLELVNHIKHFKTNFIHITSSWNSNDCLSPSIIQKIYTETILIPIPMGNIHEDTYRIYEVLESGSIPVIKLYGKSDYFENIFGKHPIPIVKNWDELKNVYCKIKPNLNSYLQELNMWYDNFKLKTREIVNILN